MTQKLYLETVGCQMNVLDSELVVGSLRRQGYELTYEPTDADVILFNTCSVRQHAEDKIYSALGRLRAHKRRRPDTIIGVLGCMAQKDQTLVRRRAPHVDIVCGTGQLARLPELVAAVESTGGRQVALSLARNEAPRHEVERSFESYDPTRDPSMRPSPFQAYVRIMIGCDKFCTYCIVPSVRGPEQSRQPAHIAAEVSQLALEGCNGSDEDVLTYAMFPQVAPKFFATRAEGPKNVGKTPAETPKAAAAPAGDGRKPITAPVTYQVRIGDRSHKVTVEPA